jgi:2-enoate reductase
MGRLTVGKPMSCTVNPASGRERAYGLNPAKEPRKVMVIGGGVAGMEAGRVAALRGHKVVLYEKSDKLGGHVSEASILPFKSSESRLLQWYQTELEDLKVEIQFNVEVSPEFVHKKNPDTVIVATGSKPIHLNVPGADKQTVITACDFLAGKRRAGEIVMIIGGGQVGCEIGLWLAQQGKEVTIVEKLSDLLVGGRRIPWMNRMMLLDLLKFHKVNVMTNVSLLEVTDKGAVVIDKNFRRDTLPAYTIILAVGLEPEQGIYRLLKGHSTHSFLIGDARKPWNIMSAIWDAYEVARTI